tara:strand:+ start:660 stop:1421 length:762 start_codon:yes stop_codon:yes gene_type:complete
MGTHFKIIVPFYNVEKWIKLTVNSILLQDYKDYECVFINDLSTDDTLNILEKSTQYDKRFKIINNKEKKYVLQNICSAIQVTKPKPEDIIVILDGDDWFANKKVLSLLNDTYNQNDCWLTYGSYVEYPSGIKGKFSRKIPENIIENNLFRESPWMTSHLRTWKYGLWKGIDQERSFTEPDVIDETNHFANCWDLAYMFPLIELAGNRSHYISDTLYIYNRQNPLNVDKLDNRLQIMMEQKIRNMEKYSPLKKL